MGHEQALAAVDPEQVGVPVVIAAGIAGRVDRCAPSRSSRRAVQRTIIGGAYPRRAAGRDRAAHPGDTGGFPLRLHQARAITARCPGPRDSRDPTCRSRGWTRRAVPLSDGVAAAIRGHIMRGDYAVGTWLPGERELGEELGVSRVAVREALKMLEADGLVRAHPGRGRLVTGGGDGRRSRVLVENWLSEHRGDGTHLSEIRAAIEGLAVAGIPPRNRADVALRLRRIAAEGRLALASEDHARTAELDAEFHTVLCAETPNQPLRDLAGGLIALALRTSLPATADAGGRSLDQHVSIADDIESGAIRSARTTLRRHG